MEGSKGDKARLFSVVPSERTRGNGHNLKYRKIHLNIQKHIFIVTVVNAGTDCPERLWRLHPWRYTKPEWTWS